ncbi:hypothetical protein G7Y41_01400 [Schaalia sp. ZJ405]|uniref:hypothetical protein n=1 Tax=Schaalia sp. ZJ405 TaxID=2709403 RepID=UPI0013ECC929|nr:hypothetical protein [Schaalia sp. ZJ405]QPK81539.1 hypothetical protein G7Y41_01400 [Schaalia sp. ZJ405]
MALFEFEDGRLIPAQFGYPVAQGVSPEMTNAVCSQVLEIVSRPLFPITWNDVARTRDSGSQAPRLTALDAAGQVVSVEVVAHLDSDMLIASLSRLAEAASLSWSDLAQEHPGGIDGFKRGWIQFRDAMPPSAGAGPRLVMVVGSIAPEVRPALDVLATSGVEVHEMTIRQMSNGRMFLEVQEVGPRLYGHAPQVVLGGSGQLSEITAARDSREDSRVSQQEAAPAREQRPSPTDPVVDRLVSTDPLPHQLTPVPTPAEQMASAQAGSSSPSRVGRRRVSSESTDRNSFPSSEAFPHDRGDRAGGSALNSGGHGLGGVNDGGASDAAVSSSVDTAVGESPLIADARAAGLPLLNRDVEGLTVLAQLIGEDTALIAHSDLLLPQGLVLSKFGNLRAGGASYASPEDLFSAYSVSGQPWELLRLADRQGPTLAESLDEINVAIIREFENAPARGGRRGKH